MQAAAPQELEQDAICDRPTALSREEAQREDAFWQRNYWQERYYEDDFEYEDYAPAYCVGYAGCAQYGGDFKDAERCLWANWERIKGDSRLSPQQALPAIRAAWDRLVRLRRRQLQPAVNDPSFARRRTRAETPFSRTVPTRADAAVATL
ncbi:MAG: hypothetical protein ACYC0T_00245 [Ramlibacter sp.]